MLLIKTISMGLVIIIINGFSWNWENTIQIDKTFGAHSITLLGGTSAYDWDNRNYGFSKTYLGGQ